MGVSFHPLVDRDGLCLLLCLLRHSLEGGPKARSSMVSQESQRPRLQSNPGDDSSEHTQAHAQVSCFWKKRNIDYINLPQVLRLFGDVWHLHPGDAVHPRQVHPHCLPLLPPLHHPVTGD